MKRRSKIFLAVALVLVVMQAFRPERNISSELLPTDITRVMSVPGEVQAVLKRACYDCHSNNTEYPWYTNVQPIGWYLANHVKDGKRHLNFSDFGSYPAGKQRKKLEETSEEVREGEMPLSSYTVIHKGARLSEQEKALLMQWADSAASGVQ